jgi:hypothetical protein
MEKSAKRNLMIRRILEFPLIFMMLILSLGVSGALILRTQLTLDYFALLLPMLFASFVSSRRFYKIIQAMDGK